MITLLLIGRNLRLYIRDKLGVFFSLLSALILIGLYALFLGQSQIDSLSQSFPKATSVEVKGFIYSWVIAGVAMITTLTVSFSTVGTFVDDRASGRFQDFLVSPVRRLSLVLGYLVSGAVVAIIVTTLVLIGGQIVIAALGAPVMSIGQSAAAFGWIVLSSVAFSAFSSFLVSFLRTQGALSALGTIVGTVIGFLAGAYIPLGALPVAARNVVGSLPFGQAAMLIRGPLTAETLSKLTDGSSGAADTTRRVYGVTLHVAGTTVSTGWAAAELLAVAVVFAALAVLRLNRGIR